MTTTPPEIARLFGIRETSDEAGMSIDTLRWYEREGLIPGVMRNTVGRRLYGPTTRGFIQLIAALRRTGMPVAEVRAFVGLGPGTTANHRPRLEILRHQLEQIELHQRQLNDDRAAITAKISQYRSLIARGLNCEDEIAELHALKDGGAAQHICSHPYGATRQLARRVEVGIEMRVDK